MNHRGEQFVLKWHYQEATLVRHLHGLLDSEMFTDVTLSVENGSARAHKVVLAMCSAYFLQLFQEMETTSHVSTPVVVVLHNVTLSDLRAILAFIYKGQCLVTRDQMPGLISVAKLLKIQGLRDMKVPELRVVSNDVIQSNDSTKINTNSNYGPSVEDFPREAVPGPQQFTDVNRNDDNNNNGDNEPSSEERLVGKTAVIYNDIPPILPLALASTSGTTTKKVHYNTSNSSSNHNTNGNNKDPPLSETCKCFLCGKYLSNQYNLRVHMETHEEAFHACQSCPHVSRSRDALRKHVSYRHPEEYLTRKRKKIS